MEEMSKYRPSKFVLVVALLLGIIATLFPPFEWNHIREGTTSNRERTSTYYVFHSTPIKTYDFLFANNQKEFRSDVSGQNETFTRSIILPELLVEYFLIGIVTVLFHILFFKISKKNL